MLIFRIIPCNSFLSRIRIRDSDLCEYCKEPDTLTHFFICCKIFEHLWHAICNWYNRISQQEAFHPLDHQMMFGVLNDPRRIDVKTLNVVIMLTKIYIHFKRLFHQSTHCIGEWLVMLGQWVIVGGDACKSIRQLKKFKQWGKNTSESELLKSCQSWGTWRASIFADTLQCSTTIVNILMLIFLSSFFGKNLCKNNPEVNRWMGLQ